MNSVFLHNLFYVFPVLFCFCLPFGSLVLSAIIVLWVLVSFFTIRKETLRAGFSNKLLAGLYLFFLLTVISALLSSNAGEAGFSVEVKLSFLFLPYLFYCFQWPADILKRCVISFVSGCFFACLYLVIRAFVYALNGHPEYFFYTLFSDFIHASYFAMYLLFAMTCILVFYPGWFGAEKRIGYSSGFFLLIFALSVFLCSSKLGLISFFLCLPLWLAYRFRKQLSLKSVLLSVLLLAGVGWGMMKLVPEPFSRFSSLRPASLDHIDKTSSESTGVRILIWKEALGLIGQHPLFGTGVGDANDALYGAYLREGMTGAYQHRLNAHNQFFQTFIGMGLAGFVLLCLITFGGLVREIRRRHFAGLIFYLLIILNFMVESMLQTSAGVLFFVFFTCLLDRLYEKQTSGESPAVSPATPPAL
jgi:O-antigen ligase